MPKKVSNARNQGGFTLVELLLVVVIIAVLTRSLYSVINYVKHKQNAQDAVMRATMEKLVTALEAYRTVEGHYPTDPNGDFNPSDDPYLSNYVDISWPNGQPAGSVYRYYVDSTGYTMGLVVSLNSGKTIKYRNDWSQLQECATGASPNDGGC